MRLDDYRKVAQKLNPAIEAAVEANGLKMTKLTASVDETSGEVRLTLRLFDPKHTGTDGESTTPDRERFKQYAPMIGLKADDLDREFTSGGTVYKIAGLRANGKRRLVAANPAGKLYVFTVEDVRKLLPKKEAAAA